MVVAIVVIVVDAPGMVDFVVGDEYVQKKWKKR